MRSVRGDLCHLLSLPVEQFEAGWNDFLTLQVAREILAVRDPGELYPAAFKRDAAAAYLGIGGRTFDSEVREQLPYKLVNSVRLYRRADLDAWLANTEPAPRLPGSS